MKKLISLIILTVITLGCANERIPKVEQLPVTETQEIRDTIFRQITDFPKIKDSAQFISALQQVFKLEVDESSHLKKNEKITTYKKVRIYGSDSDYFFIEFDYGDGCGAAFPWKFQLLLTADGKLVKTLSGQRFEFVEIFKNENPFLLTVIGTDKGNGGHEIYKISGDTLENVYEGYFDYGVRTYDAHEDNRIYEPNELTLKVKDFNNDGLNDLSFNGKIVLIQGQSENGAWIDAITVSGKTIEYSVDNPFKKIPVEFIFLYDKQTGHFKAKENYTEKYELNN